jgi:hypothetical protein
MEMDSKRKKEQKTEERAGKEMGLVTIKTEQESRRWTKKMRQEIWLIKIIYIYNNNNNNII